MFGSQVVSQLDVIRGSNSSCRRQQKFSTIAFLMFTENDIAFVDSTDTVVDSGRGNFGQVSSSFSTMIFGVKNDWN